uniref:Uncharacterized protein n=1 Tax=Candidatus Kentrum sp. TUN TaxID=2126343 RepID=A0A451AQ27_9GAMM|nr:MAG: hypothetical protein BECKTUN1418E_GA0071001_11805 [Candidatus Kentron sp. TUN]
MPYWLFLISVRSTYFRIEENRGRFFSALLAFYYALTEVLFG